MRVLSKPPTLAAWRATSGTFRGADTQRLGKQWPRAASGVEALQDLLTPPIGEPESDPALEIDPLKHNRERRVALCPPRISQVLLRCVRDGARPQEESAPTQPDDRLQRPEDVAVGVEHGLVDHLVRTAQQLRGGGARALVSIIRLFCDTGDSSRTQSVILGRRPATV